MNVSLITAWPWLCTAGAVVIVIMLFATDKLRNDKRVNRWRDPVWFGWLTTACLMLHVTEEYGIDFMGRTYEFPNMMRTVLETALGNNAVNFPPDAMFPLVNLSMAFFALPAAALLAKKHPLALTGAVGLLAINSVTHIGPGIAMHSYNPGMISGIVLFIPLTVWYVHAFFGKEHVGRKYAWFILVNGIVAMGVIGGSIVNYVFGNIPMPALMAAHVVNAVLLACLPLLEEKLFSLTPDRIHK